MVKILRCGLVLLVGILVLCDAASSIAGQVGSEWLVSPALLRAGKLETVWENKLPLKKGETLKDLYLLGERIYALSDRNYMVSLDREKGNVLFSRSVASAGFPAVGLGLYEDKLFSIIGNELVELNPEFGTELGRMRLRFGVVCPAVRNSSHFYLSSTDKRIHAFRAADKVKAFEVAADSDSRITSVIAEEDFVVFATEAGDCVSIRPDGPSRLWQFNAGGIVGPIVREGEALFFASKDTNVYKLDIMTGRLVWKHQTGAMLENGPRVTDEAVYQYVRGEGLAAIDKRGGKALWQLPEGVDLLAESDGKAYLITKTGRLAVMDHKKGGLEYSVNFAGVSKYAVNVADSKIYIADGGGRIACLKPIE